ncbi:myeloid-associated differentiation marker homolog [Chaetodon auriga]|uniref:myeloid-associated differentiation marker homolog n=1 Tax=Chaetodon auriga TaxID=39042 RepID=UPI0040328D1C
MVRVELRAVTQPVGIMRIMAVILTCISFSLVAYEGHVLSTYWAWCMFTWCFCFFFTFLIVILEFTTVNTKLPFAWDDFTAAFAMLASLMCLAVSIMYPTFFTCKTCHLQITASVVSWVCFGMYTAEVVYTRLHPIGQTSGFLSTLPGIMKMLETFLACLIFTSLETNQFSSPGLQWCVSVYILCFIFVILIILLTLGRLTSYFPFSFDKLVIVYNVLAAAMYTTAMVIWPLYSFPTTNSPTGEAWDKLLVVTLMTILNCIVYILDSAYSIRLVFCMSNQD